MTTIASLRYLRAVRSIIGSLLFVSIAPHVLPAQWTPTDAHVLADFQRLAISREGHIWAFTRNGDSTICVSKDEGQHWIPRPISDTAGLGLVFPDSIQVAGDKAFEVRVSSSGTSVSVDSGKTWTSIDTVAYSAVISLGGRFIAVGPQGHMAYASAAAIASVVRREERIFTHADTLRGSITPERAWWDVVFYDLHVAVNPADSTIRGWNGIRYRVVGPARPEMQIDLQMPLEVDSMVQNGQHLSYRRDGGAFFVTPTQPESLATEHVVTVYYHGRPRIARMPPWDGGFVWAHDSIGHPWVADAVQLTGASAWWPTKDVQADEPDSQRIAITVPDSLVDISNGRLRHVEHHADGTATYEWFVRNPINNYDVTVYIGVYHHDSTVFAGERGPLTLDFWALPYHVDTARKQFAQVAPMLRCFERWFGPFPWYQDGYKLVEAPYLGMEHQSAVAYGNRFKNGYLGMDLSGSGWGLKWDYIIVHESAHEWFGNNITTADVADMWVHESFANYAEALYTECQSGRKAGAEYVIGMRAKIANDAPAIGAYGVNDEGSEDMYFKGANMLHTIRTLVGNDSVWRNILRGLNHTFWHKVVTGEEIEHYMTAHAGIDLAPVFKQYLTTTHIPVLEYAVQGNALAYRWVNVFRGFHMPVHLDPASDHAIWLNPTTTWQVIRLPKIVPTDVQIDQNLFVSSQRVPASAAHWPSKP